MSEKRERLQALGGLRFLAALHLVAFHLGAAGGLDGQAMPGFLRAFVRSGDTNTALFVVLSGFVLHYGYTNAAGALRVPARQFWLTRFAQVYPAMIVAHLLTAPGVLLGPVHYGVGEAVVRGALVTTATQAWVPPFAFSYAAPAWTISALAFCYALFPVLCRAVNALSRPQAFAALGATWLVVLLPNVLCLAFAPGAVNIVEADPTNVWSTFLHVFPLLLLPVFFSGMLLARLFVEEGWASRANGPALTVGALLGIAGAIAARDHIPYVLLHNGLLLPLHWMLMAGLATGRGVVPRLLSTPRLAALGGASMVIYLLHSPFQGWFLYVLRHLWLWEGTLVPVLGYLGGTVYVSLLVTRHFANPCADWIRARWGAPARQRPFAVTDGRAMEPGKAA
jgi:peptidoglycan/LPS O-acetylase OafA/YrhL